MRKNRFDSSHRRMEPVQLRGTARCGDHSAEEDDVGPTAHHFFNHLLIAQTKRTAVEHRYLGALFLTNKSRHLGMQRIDGEMLITPRGPIPHGRGYKEELHGFSDRR
jgi:hypothetical protein